MKTIPEALQDLYVALGGDVDDVQNCTTSVEVLNAIADKYEGASDAVLNSDAIENIAAVADDIAGSGSSDFSTAEVTISLQKMSSTTGGTMTFTFPNIRDEKITLTGLVLNNAVDLGGLYSETFTVVLYKGICDNATFTPNGLSLTGNPTFTGGCALSQDGTKVVITGDGTITIPVTTT